MPLRRSCRAPAVGAWLQFKGSGWYITDYAKKSSTDAGESKTADKTTTESKSESKAESKPAADTKPATKTD